MARGQTMKAIEEAIARLESERAALKNKIERIDGKIEGFRESMLLQSGATPASSDIEKPKRTRRGNLKETVLDIAAEVGDNGMTADKCVTIAKAKGIDLIRESVSSLLSRLKNDGVLFFDGQVYRLKQYAGPRQAA